VYHSIWPTRGWGTSAQPRTSHGIADHEWRCWPLHKNAMPELAHIGMSGRVRTDFQLAETITARRHNVPSGAALTATLIGTVRHISSLTCAGSCDIRPRVWSLSVSCRTVLGLCHRPGLTGRRLAAAVAGGDRHDRAETDIGAAKPEGRRQLSAACRSRTGPLHSCGQPR
jgi:hypothetical protein